MSNTSGSRRPGRTGKNATESSDSKSKPSASTSVVEGAATRSSVSQSVSQSARGVLDDLDNNGSRMDGLIKLFRKEMSELLDERLAAIIVHNEELKRDVASLSSRVQELESRNVQLTETVQFLTEDAPAPRASGTLTTVQPASNANLNSTAADEIIERVNRSNNIILKGIPEEDDEVLADVVSTVLDIERGAILSNERIGRRANDGARAADDEPGTNTSATSGAPTARLIRVRLADTRLKSKLYSTRFGLEYNGSAVYVQNDLTKQQLAQKKKTLPLYKQLRKQKVQCQLPYGEILDKDGMLITEQAAMCLLKSD